MSLYELDYCSLFVGAFVIKGETKMISKIKADLKNIRHYYSNEEIFNKGFQKTGENSIVEVANKYNEILVSAPAKLYQVYVYLYIEGNTQEAMADKLNFSPEYINRLNKKLVLYILSRLKGDNNDSINNAQIISLDTYYKRTPM